MRERKVVQRGRGSGKTLALQLLAIGAALKDPGKWVTFLDHTEAPHGMKHRWAQRCANNLRLLISEHKWKDFRVRVMANLIHIRFDLPPVMTDDEVEAIGMSRELPVSERPHKV